MCVAILPLISANPQSWKLTRLRQHTHAHPTLSTRPILASPLNDYRPPRPKSMSAPTQVLPSWLTLSTTVITLPDGSLTTASTTLQLPLTYFGPSVSHTLSLYA